MGRFQTFNICITQNKQLTTKQQLTGISLRKYSRKMQYRIRNIRRFIVEGLDYDREALGVGRDKGREVRDQD